VTRTRKKRRRARRRNYRRRDNDVDSKLTFQLDADGLFKYCDQRGIDILQSLRLKVTPPIEFNDPFEFMPKVDLAITAENVSRGLRSKRMLRQIWKEMKIPMDFEAFQNLYLSRFEQVAERRVKATLKKLQAAADDARDDILRFMSTAFALACYSEIPDNFLMWSHYTAGHQGVVIEFNVTNQFFIEPENLMPVVYRSERVNATYSSRGLSFIEPNIGLVRTKNLDWSYEKEWRQMFPLETCTKIHRADGTITYFQPLPPKALKSVILGTRCQPATENVVRELIRRRDLRHIRLKRAVLHERDFRLKIVDA
jgi:hypothetical protein